MNGNLADDGVVGGGDGVEDPLDALQLLLVAGGDAVEGLVVVLQGAAALAAGKQEVSEPVPPALAPKPRPRPCHSHVDGVGHLHVSHLHQPGEVHLLLDLPVAPHLHRGVPGLQLSLQGSE